jgi:hypothetical protein
MAGCALRVTARSTRKRNQTASATKEMLLLTDTVAKERRWCCKDVSMVCANDDVVVKMCSGMWVGIRATVADLVVKISAQTTSSPLGKPAASDSLSCELPDRDKAGDGYTRLA